MADQPSISVVIPTAGRPSVVTRALDSVLVQTLPPIEVILVVDGVDDETRAALAPHEPSIRIIQLPKRRGGAGARSRSR